MKNRILFDTCAWIDFLRFKDGKAGNLLEDALKDDTALLCGVIAAELLQGGKSKKETLQLDLLFSGVESLPCDESVWNEAGLILQNLRQKGITVPLTDALIAVIANHHHVAVATIDKHFQYLPVKLINLAN